MEEHTIAPEAENQTTAAAPERSPASAPAPQQGRARLPAWAGLVLAVNLGATAFLGWQWQQQRQQLGNQRGELAQRLEASDTVAKEARGLARQSQEDLSALQSRLGALEDKVGQSEGQAAALASLYQEFSRNRDDQMLAEVGQSLGIAAQQLQLAGNVSAALLALQNADHRLAGLDRPQFLPLRQAIAHDIDALQAAPQLDVSGLALRIEALMVSADGLPLAFAGAPQDQNAQAEASRTQAEPTDMAGRALAFVTALGRDLWHELRGLVRVERLDGPAPTLLAPEQSAFLRESLKIRLLTARLALLARDGRTYAVDLSKVREWMERYYDVEAPAVKGALEEISKLQAVSFSATPPSIADSQAALAALQSRPGAKSLPAGSAATH